MPSPVGHVLAGIAIGAVARRESSWRLPLICGLMAALPDIDFLLPLPHRGQTHSVGAALGAFVVALAVVSSGHQRLHGVRIAAAIGLAVLSHVLLDWLGQDRSSPRGLMALWPWTATYYVSDVNVFNGVDRRYWLEGFWRRNTIAVTKEIAILLPIVWLSTRRIPGRSFDPGVPRPPSA